MFVRKLPFTAFLINDFFVINKTSRSLEHYRVFASTDRKVLLTTYFIYASGPILIPTRDHVTEVVNGFPPHGINLKIVVGASKQETNGFQPGLKNWTSPLISTSYS